jgi:hypothetical protein
MPGCSKLIAAACTNQIADGITQLATPGRGIIAR